MNPNLQAVMQLYQQFGPQAQQQQDINAQQLRRLTSENDFADETQGQRGSMLDAQLQALLGGTENAAAASQFAGNRDTREELAAPGNRELTEQNTLAVQGNQQRQNEIGVHLTEQARLQAELARMGLTEAAATGPVHRQILEARLADMGVNNLSARAGIAARVQESASAARMGEIDPRFSTGDLPQRLNAQLMPELNLGQGQAQAPVNNQDLRIEQVMRLMNNQPQR
tara:strand:- start:1894 stop:2574 length:681 start_codon:yes stop_codon:yes gene_type:complete